MNVRKIITYIIITLLIISNIYFINKSNNNTESKVYINTTKSINNSDSTLAIMVETGLGTNTYEESTSTTWPSGDYSYNSSLSSCERGS